MLEVVCRSLVGGQEFELVDKLKLKQLERLTRWEQKETLLKKLTGKIFADRGSLRKNKENMANHQNRSHLVV